MGKKREPVRLTMYLKPHGPEGKLGAAIKRLPHGYKTRLLVEAIALLVEGAYRDSMTVGELEDILLRIAEPKMREPGEFQPETVYQEVTNVPITVGQMEKVKKEIDDNLSF